MGVLKKIVLTGICLALSAVAFNAAADTEKEEGVLPRFNIKAEGTFDMYSKYIWRGFALDTDPVIQPGFSLSGYGVTFTYWSSWDLDNDDGIDGDEIDYVIDYTKEFESLSLFVGHTYYEFPGTDTFSKEYYIGLGLPDFPLSPAVTYYYDYGNENQGGGDGQYLTLTGSYTFDAIKDFGITMEIGGSVAYNRKLFISGEGGNALVSAGLGIPLYKDLMFTPSVNYSVPFGRMRDSDDGNQKKRSYYGFSIGYAF